MSALDLARWQFGVTTDLPLHLRPDHDRHHLVRRGLPDALVPAAATPTYLRLTRFFGKLMLINFAIGVVTGIVQEFQFGMNWSAYSRYVGDIFGAPLAMEALAAFFLESTFLGLWIFGWGRLSPRLHLAIDLRRRVRHRRSAPTSSWPPTRGCSTRSATRSTTPRGRAEMTSIGKVLTNSTLLYAFPHTIGAAVHDRRHDRGRRLGLASRARLRRRRCSRRAIRLALPIVFVAAIFTTLVGHGQAQLMTKQQPMKMAAAEALYTTQTGAPFSLFAVAPFEHSARRGRSFDITHPARPLDPRDQLLERQGRGRQRPQRARTRRSTAPGDYAPDHRRHLLVVPDHDRHRRSCSIAAHRARAVLLCAGHARASRRYLRLATWAIALPILANAAGWIFTEMGRQPWVVQGLLLTRERGLAERLGLGGRRSRSPGSRCSTACSRPSTAG